MNEKNREILFSIISKREDVEQEIDEELNKIKTLINNENPASMCQESNITFYINKLNLLKDLSKEREKLLYAEKVINTIVFNS